MVDGIRVKINRAGPRPDYQGDERQVRQYLALWLRYVQSNMPPACAASPMPIHLSVSGV